MKTSRLLGPCSTSQLLVFTVHSTVSHVRNTRANSTIRKPSVCEVSIALQSGFLLLTKNHCLDSPPLCIHKSITGQRGLERSAKTGKIPVGSAFLFCIVQYLFPGFKSRILFKLPPLGTGTQDFFVLFFDSF